MDYSKKGLYDIEKPAEYKNAVARSTSYAGGVGKWKAANAGKVKGTEMVPEADKTYFLKEVPDGFLCTKIYLIYDAINNNTVVHNYLISDVDDNNYSDIGLYAKDITTGNRIKLAASYTIIDTFNSRTDKITAKDSFEMQAGYVAVWNPDLAKKDFEIAAAYTTPDGVRVEGKYIRMITIGDGTYKGTFDADEGGFAISDKLNNRIMKPGNIKKVS
jgi:hypothetical protein